MGDYKQKVEQRNIDEIMKKVMKTYDVWSKDKNNKGKVFRYEINPSKFDK